MPTINTESLCGRYCLVSFPLGGQSIGRHALVVSFLKGARRLHPSRPSSVPPWDLDVVLRALSQPPFKPLASVDMKEQSLKTVLLLALASAKRIGDLHAFSVDSVFASDPVTAASLSGQDRATCLNRYLPPSERRLFCCLPCLRSHQPRVMRNSVCPVRALRIYIDRLFS